MPEKKCHNCKNMDFCAMRLNIISMAPLLNINLKDDMAGDSPVIYMLNTMAHDCKRFQAMERS